jgi:hypothetical protein
MTTHHHAVCDRCGLVRDVPCQPPAERCAELAPAPVSPAPGFEVRAVERIYRGLCAACSTSARRSRSTDSGHAETRPGALARPWPAGARGARRPERV